MNNKNFISVDSNKVIFTKSKQNIYLSTLSIQNISKNVVIYKIFINKSKIYRASPSEGFLSPKGSIKISIKRTASEATPSEKPDQVLIIAFETNQVIKTVNFKFIYKLEEAKSLLKKDVLNSENQQIFLDVQIDSEHSTIKKETSFIYDNNETVK